MNFKKAPRLIREKVTKIVEGDLGRRLTDEDAKCIEIALSDSGAETTRISEPLSSEIAARQGKTRTA